MSGWESAIFARFGGRGCSTFIRSILPHRTAETLFKNDSVAFENRDAERVFGFFQQCYSQGYFPRTFFQGGDPFLLERKATHFAGPWEIATISKFAPNIHFDVAPLPVPDDHQGPVYTSGDYKNIAIFSTTEHPKESWEFVKFLVTAEHDLLMLEITNQVPVRGDLLTNPLFARYFAKNPLMVKFAETGSPHPRDGHGCRFERDFRRDLARV